MMQTIEKRQIERRVSERRRSRTSMLEAGQGIYLCDCCGYDAVSRKDDLCHHTKSLLHALARIAFQLLDISADLSRSLTVSISKSVFCKESFIFLPFEKWSHVGKNKLNAAVVGHNHSTGNLCAACTTSKQRSKLPAVEELGENLHTLGQALTIAAMVLGGVAFAAVSFLFAIFPGDSKSDNFHETLDREFRKKRDEDRRRLDEDEDERRRSDDEAYWEKKRSDDLWRAERDAEYEIAKRIDYEILRGRQNSFSDDRDLWREEDRRRDELKHSSNLADMGQISGDDFSKEQRETQLKEDSELEKKTKRNKKN